MPANTVLDDRTEDPAHVRVQAITTGELEGMLALQGVRRIVTLQQILRIIKQHTDIGTAVDIDKAQ